MTDETCCGACGFPIHATKEMACDWCRQSTDRIQTLIAERDEAWKRAARAEKMWGEAEVKLAKAVEALQWIADPISLAQGNVNAEIARATLAEIKGGNDAKSDL